MQRPTKQRFSEAHTVADRWVRNRAQPAKCLSLDAAKARKVRWWWIDLDKPEDREHLLEVCDPGIEQVEVARVRHQVLHRLICIGGSKRTDMGPGSTPLGIFKSYRSLQKITTGFRPVGQRAICFD
jgi:hypothetical protein